VSHGDRTAPDGLGRWLLGGLAAGGLVLGLLVAAYAIGYHRGKDAAREPAGAGDTPPPAATTTGASPAPAVGTVTVTPALVARGKALYSSRGCVACHSLAGTAGAGPSLRGIAGAEVALADGSTVAADDAYLAESITDSDARIVKGYRAGVMPAAIAPFRLETKPDEVRALVAFIKSQT